MSKPDAKKIREFVELADSSQPICAYSDEEAVVKEKFLRLGRYVAKKLAEALGLQPGEYQVHVNRAGIACSGDIYMHSDWLYVSFGQGVMQELGYMYRSCEPRGPDGRWDCGALPKHANQWMKYRYLLDLDEAARMIASRLQRRRGEAPVGQRR